jgi:FkbM family methyltransferase
MKELTTLKSNKWVWPINDEKSWENQNEYQNLSDKVLPYVKNKNIMIQAGSNCGFILSKFVEHFHTIYTFEPDPLNFYCLNQNVVSPNVIKMQVCLGNKSETVKTQQLIRPNSPHDIGGVHVNGLGFTPTIIIDDLNLPGCDLIQLDVEGYELRALLGMNQTIKKYKPTLCIEFCEKWLNRYNTNSVNILNFLKDIDYHQVDEYGVDKIFVYNKL